MFLNCHIFFQDNNLKCHGGTVCFELSKDIQTSESQFQVITD